MAQLFFNSEEKGIIAFLNELLIKNPSLKTDESAVRSFTHNNLFIRWFFWQRIRYALKIAKDLPSLKVLDFGTGSGVLLPFLDPRAEKLYGLDLDTKLADKIKDGFDLKNTQIIEYLDGRIPLDTNAVDLIFALEAFEHEEQLHKYIDEIHRVCKKNGYLLFSIPTENFIYKTGRFFSGFKNDYHKISKEEIFNEVRKKFTELKLIKLYPIIPFYIFGLFKKE